MPKSVLQDWAMAHPETEAEMDARLTEDRIISGTVVS